jgi:hypothetical protein
MQQGGHDEGSLNKVSLRENRGFDRKVCKQCREIKSYNIRKARELRSMGINEEVAYSRKSAECCKEGRKHEELGGVGQC